LHGAKLVLSLEGDKWLAERADDALSACLRDRFPSRFLLSAKCINASLSGWHSLSALSSLSETSTLVLLQNNSFLFEIEEKLTLIPYTRFLLSTNKNKSKFIYNPTKRTINWGKYIHFVKVFYTKVSHIRRLKNSPKFTILLVLKQRKNRSLVLKWQNHSGYSQGFYSKEFSHMTWMTYNASINSFSLDKQLLKDMNMIIKKHNWNKLVRMTDIKEGSSPKAEVTISLKHKCLGYPSINNQHKSQSLHFISYHTVKNTQTKSEGLY